jgi:peptidoglycan/xylan/chitin deacetylase (PgdA/CDA1 family)
MGEPGGFRLPYSGPAIIALGCRLFPQCLWKFETNKKRIALTFDDGPSVAFLPGLLDVLDRLDTRATFFLLGDRLADGQLAGCAQRRELVRRLVADGHEIAFHGWHHQPVWRMSEKSISEDIARFREVMGELIGDEWAGRVRFFRPPFGRVTAKTIRAFESANFKVVQASILSGDVWMWPNHYMEVPGRSVSRILREAKSGAILCLHVGEDIGLRDAVYDACHVVEIVEQVIPKLRDEGFEFSPLGRVLG